LCEYNKNELSQAVTDLIEGKLTPNECEMICVEFNNQTYYAINDVLVERIYTTDSFDSKLNNVACDFLVSIGDSSTFNFKGDGAIISTPTGSTAYSFSLGGPILFPQTPAFILTKIAAHSFNQRPIVFPSNINCSIKVCGVTNAGIFIDGKMLSVMKKGDQITISKLNFPLVFYRRNTDNFFKKLSYKLGGISGDNNE
jgi:NAD+ kinase